MELKDPITNAPLTEEQLLAAKLAETIITPSDDENSSIITVRSNASNNDSMVRLHLAADTADSNGATVAGTGAMATAEVQSGPTGSYLTAVQHHQVSSSDTDANTDMQTIVEVVNPLIAGQGYANTIAVGHHSGGDVDGPNPSFDPSIYAAESNYDSLDAYKTASEMSLSDKMKNVLKELVKNERVRLSFSQSLSDGDGDSDSEQNDTDNDANEPLKHDSSDDDESTIPPASAITVSTETATEAPSVITAIETAAMAAAATVAAPVTEENGNAVIAQLNIVDEHHDSSNNDKNANIIDNDFIFQNPNFVDEIDVRTVPQSSSVRNERNEKLKEKLLSELEVQPSGSESSPSKHLAKVKPITVVTAPVVVVTESTNQPDDEESSIHDDVPTTPTSLTEASSKSDSISSTGSGKRKKRKNRPRKK